MDIFSYVTSLALTCTARESCACLLNSNQIKKHLLQEVEFTFWPSFSSVSFTLLYEKHNLFLLVKSCFIVMLNFPKGIQCKHEHCVFPGHSNSRMGRTRKPEVKVLSEKWHYFHMQPSFILIHRSIRNRSTCRRGLGVQLFCYSSLLYIFVTETASWTQVLLPLGPSC